MEWDVAELSPEMHQKFITDPRIPELIDKKLGDLHWETYWKAVSEAATMLLKKYLDKSSSEAEANPCV